MAETFGSRLSALLRERKLSQKDLAIKAGVTESAMSHYVRGDRVPRASVLARIADSLGTSSDFLMNGSAVDIEGELKQAKRLIARNVSHMSQDEKMEIISILLGDE